MRRAMAVEGKWPESASVSAVRLCGERYVDNACAASSSNLRPKRSDGGGGAVKANEHFAVVRRREISPYIKAGKATHGKQSSAAPQSPSAIAGGGAEAGE